MIEFYLTKEQLERALVCLNQAAERGFPASQAIFGLTSVGDRWHGPWSEDSEFKDQIILKAHPTDDTKNWGRIGAEQITWHRFDDGVLINTYEEEVMKLKSNKDK